MILDVSVYLVVFTVTVYLASLFQKTYNRTKIRYSSADGKNFNTVMYCVVYIPGNLYAWVTLWHWYRLF